MGCQPFHPLPFPCDLAVPRRLLGCAIRAGVPGLQTPPLPVTELKGGGVWLCCWWNCKKELY